MFKSPNPRTPIRPAGTPTRTPARIPAHTPARTPGRTPGRTPATEAGKSVVHIATPRPVSCPLTKLAHSINGAFVDIEISATKLRLLTPVTLCALLEQMLRSLEELPVDYDAQPQEGGFFAKRQCLFRSLSGLISKYGHCLDLPADFSIGLVLLLDPGQSTSEPVYHLLSSLAIFRSKITHTQNEYGRAFLSSSVKRQQIDNLEQEHSANQEKLAKMTASNRALFEKVQERKKEIEKWEEKIAQLEERRDAASELCINFMGASIQDDPRQ